MNNGTTHYIVEFSKFNKWLRAPVAQYGYALTPSPLEATQFVNLDDAKRHIKIYSEIHSINEMEFKILEVTVQHTYKEVITKEMALKCLEIFSEHIVSTKQERINAKDMLTTFIEQRG